MREFAYFLFENFDADEERNHPHNPRRFLGKETDAILSEVAQSPVNTCSYRGCCEKYGTEFVQKLTDGGILRSNGTGLLFDCPIFLREDTTVLQTEIASKASALVDMVEQSMTSIYACCAKIDNGFSVEYNLYHILCGIIFDGYFFDYLSNQGVLATSRKHPSGLDYLTVIYEKCNELQMLSDNLLCSYNRLVNTTCSLQSFGNAQGNRFDFYRFFRLLEQNKLPHQFKEAEQLLLDNFGGINKEFLLHEVASFIKTGRCTPATISLLELFGYAKNGTICVPIYTPNHRRYILEIERIMENSIGHAMSNILLALADSIAITAVKHGVNRLEIANELYHIIFGSINEELVARKLVAMPKYVPDEGRYLKCIEMYS